MKLIKASYNILSRINSDIILKSIERIGRTCYKSEDKIDKNSAKNFVGMLIALGHESVLEHEKLTIKFICDRGVSHELVRHRLASFSQESTRYCNYSKDKFDNQITFIIPNWIEESLVKDLENVDPNTITNAACPEIIWAKHMLWCEKTYNYMINHGWQPQQARSVLPNSLKTEIVVTANLREWRLILKQRTSKAAHPQMRELMCPLLDELKQKISIIFDDIDYEKL
jgi:thymidylate synthase (FAD)